MASSSKYVELSGNNSDDSIKDPDYEISSESDCLSEASGKSIILILVYFELKPQQFSLLGLNKYNIYVVWTPEVSVSKDILNIFLRE